MPTGTPPPIVIQAEQVTPAKPWWKSKTLWFNAVMLGAAAAEANLKLLQPLVPINLFEVLAFALPVGNAVLRVVTTQALSNGAKT